MSFVNVIPLKDMQVYSYTGCPRKKVSIKNFKSDLFSTLIQFLSFFGFSGSVHFV